MKPEDISKKADKERKKMEKPAQPEPVSYKESKVYEAFSFRTYSKIYPGRMNFPLWCLLCVPGITFLIMYVCDSETGTWALYGGIGFFIVFMLRWLIDLIIKLSTFSTYKTFRSRLGFNLEGWETIGTYPMQLNRRCWSKNTSIELFVKNTASDQDLKLIKDALYLFMTSANKTFYEAEMGGDGRRQWEQVNKLKLMGSSNIAVIGCVYTLLTEYLQSIQHKYHVITLVKISFDPDIFVVNPPSGD